MNPETPDAQAALLASILAHSVGLDDDLYQEVARRLAAQNDVVLAPIIQDRTVSATLSVRTIFRRLEDASWEFRST